MNLETPTTENMDKEVPVFTWIPFYEELATKLADFRNRQNELLELLKDLREQGLKITPIIDQDEDGNTFEVKEIDPFTFFGVINRQIKSSNKIQILKAFKDFFQIQADLPQDFRGIPELSNMSAIYFTYQFERQADAIDRLWELFCVALEGNPINNPTFAEAFDRALEVKNTRYKLTMGLFCIRPNAFINMDGVNREYLQFPNQKLTSKSYIEFLRAANRTGVKYTELSAVAHYSRAMQEKFSVTESFPIADSSYFQDGTQYWFVGAYWHDWEPKDQTTRFIEGGFWQNGYEDKYQDEVLAMQPGDKIIIKNSYTQKTDLPFDNEGHTISCMNIKAVGTIVSNPQDGKAVNVKWNESFQPKPWYFFTNQKTLWNLQERSILAPKLLAFIFENEPQDYEFFMNRWNERVWNKNQGALLSPGEEESIEETPASELYTFQNVLEEGVFMTEDELQETLTLLKEKKNLILQGPPGTGKTFFARKLAYLLSEQKDDSRIKIVQFHQSYSYEDFIRGYRPSSDKNTPFELVDGPFYKFCKRAQADPEFPYVFIIDEINRGNLSQIFGELLMLIEADKRGSAYKIDLMYPKFKDEPGFYVPENVYIIGMMNIADRSLALVDYALRRRFAFINLEPKFEHSRFQTWLEEQKMPVILIQEIRRKMRLLNQVIVEDRALGPAFRVGHSYFCPKSNNYAHLDKQWLSRVMRTEILPLLNEYWFDNPTQLASWSQQLLGE